MAKDDNDNWHFGGGFGPYSEPTFYYTTPPQQNSYQLKDAHKEHEVVKNFANFKEFYYCRTCKVEVDEP